MDDMQAVIDVAQAAMQAGPIAPGLYFVPQKASDASGGFVSLERFAQSPGRPRGTIEVFTAASFNEVLRSNQTGVVHTYVDRNPVHPKIVGVLNDIGTRPEEGSEYATGWRDHRVVLTLRHTPQYLKWSAIDGKLLAQAEFAEFLEDNMADVVDPPGAVLLEVASAIEVKREVAFRSAVRLSNGTVQFIHAQDDTGKSTAGGALLIPETFTIGLAPFQGSQPYAIPARFRYRLHDGKLMLGFKLQRTEDLMQRVLEDVVSQITGPIIEGSAPNVIAPY